MFTILASLFAIALVVAGIVLSEIKVADICPPIPVPGFFVKFVPAERGM